MGDPTPPTGSPAPVNRHEAQTIIPSKTPGKNVGVSKKVDDPAQTLPLTVGPADDATRLTMGAAGTAAPGQALPASDADATRVTQPDGTQAPKAPAKEAVGMGDDQRTMVAVDGPAASQARTMGATVATNEVNTLPFGQSAPGQPNTNPRSTTSSSGPSSGTFNRTSYTQRVGRTKLNQSLTAESQVLDAKLQVSRPSVLADLVSSRGSDQLPKGVRKLMEEQGTEGRYAINKELAHGGMGAVLDISDHDFRRRAAMKVILSKFASSHDAMERFLDEARVTAQLEHPNIVPIHDLGVMEDGTLYFTMKMIEGQSLGKVIKLLQQQQGLLKAKDGSLIAPDVESRVAAEHWNEQEKLHTFLKVLDGVGFAHARGVIHRDIKPDNIMLGGHGEVLVVDWGIAKILGAPEQKPTPGMMPATSATTGVISIRTEEAASATIAGSAMGTIYYMPPEQAQGSLEEMDARSDIYALGATLYELLALKRTMKPGMSVPEMLAAIIEGRWVPLDEADPTLNPDLVAIVHHAMAREPKGRYATCEAFAEDIRRYLAGVAVEARQRTSREIVAMWVAQNRKKLLAMALGLVVLIGAIYGTMALYAKQKRDHAQQLYAQAKAAYDGLADHESIEELTKISGTLGTARDSDASASDIFELNRTVLAELGAAKHHQKEIDSQRTLRDKSDELVAKAATLDETNAPEKLRDAVKLYEEAVNTADSSAIETALANDREKLKNIDHLNIMQELGAYKIQAAQYLTEAESVAKDDQGKTADQVTADAAKIEDYITRIGEQLALADKYKDTKLDGMSGLIERWQILKGEHARAVEEALNIQKGEKKAAAARNSLAANDIDEAVKDADQAIGFAPKMADVLDTTKVVAKAKFEHDRAVAEATRRKQADDAAVPLVAKANDRLQEMLKQDAVLSAAAAEVETLKRSLADQGLEAKKPLILARQAVNQAQNREVRRLARCRAPCPAGHRPPAAVGRPGFCTRPVQAGGERAGRPLPPAPA